MQEFKDPSNYTYEVDLMVLMGHLFVEGNVKTILFFNTMSQMLYVLNIVIWS